METQYGFRKEGIGKPEKGDYLHILVKHKNIRRFYDAS
jgi:hypothetical protein